MLKQIAWSTIPYSIGVAWTNKTGDVFCAVSSTSHLKSLVPRFIGQANVNSHRTIVVLSQDSHDSEWRQYELDQALMQTLGNILIHLVILCKGNLL